MPLHPLRIFLPLAAVASGLKLTASDRGCLPAAFLPSEVFTYSCQDKRRPSMLPPLAQSQLTTTAAHRANDGVEEFGRDEPRDEAWQRRSKQWVVLVDDEEAIRKSVGQFLFDAGYQVTACADADTALKICRSYRTESNGSEENNSPSLPDVIVSDIRMPGKDGLELLSDIRSDEHLVEIPVVLLTAKGLTEDRIAGFKAGADAYLPKPFDPEELLTIIDNSIQRHETLSGGNVEVDDLKRDLDDIKFMLLERGGGGVGGGWVEATNVFLAPDEREVLELLCKGLMNREIAEELFTSTRRVEQHLTSMFRKTSTSNRTELVRWAISTGNVEV
mmetsp:Transcript_28064/g.61583  ORF Transcript_28064/g.61583 Transcript_28064/m.61583 type:complete len:332 (-) Transcript_28064:56-1051(-)